MTSRVEALRDFGQQYLEHLKQFRQFVDAIAKYVQADPIPSLSLTDSGDAGFNFSYLGRNHEVVFECCITKHISLPDSRIVPKYCFRCDNCSKTLVLDQHGNVGSVEGKNSIGNIEKDPIDVFLIVLASLTSDSC